MATTADLQGNAASFSHPIRQFVVDDPQLYQIALVDITFTTPGTGPVYVSCNQLALTRYGSLMTNTLYTNGLWGSNSMCSTECVLPQPVSPTNSARKGCVASRGAPGVLCMGAVPSFDLKLDESCSLRLIYTAPREPQHTQSCRQSRSQSRSTSWAT